MGLSPKLKSLLKCLYYTYRSESSTSVPVNPRAKEYSIESIASIEYYSDQSNELSANHASQSSYLFFYQSSYSFKDV